MKFSEKIDAKPQSTTGQGFAPSKRSRPEQPQSTPDGGEDREEVVHGDISKGLSLVLTNQILRAEQTVEAAEGFTDRAAKDLAKRTHRLASGESFASKYISELNALCEQNPFGGFGSLDLTEAEAILDRMGKYSLPSVEAKFLPDS